MYRRSAVCSLVAAVTAAPAAAEDPRTSIAMPPDVRGAFPEHMRHHMDSRDDVIAQLAAAISKPRQRSRASSWYRARPWDLVAICGADAA